MTINNTIVNGWDISKCHYKFESNWLPVWMCSINMKQREFNNPEYARCDECYNCDFKKAQRHKHRELIAINALKDIYNKSAAECRVIAQNALDKLGVLL